MSMHLASHAGSEEPEMMMEINTTPLIDVMLVLLVMLIITIPIQLHAVNLELPVGAPPASLVKTEHVQIDIDEKSVVYWQGLPVSEQALGEKMRLLGLQATQPEIHIRPDRNAQYAVVANVLSSSRRTGLNRIAVVGAEQFIQ